MGKLMDNLFNDDNIDFFECFEAYRHENLLYTKGYQEVVEKIKKISAEFPEAVRFVENGATVELSLQELKAAYKILVLKEKIDTMEFKESFKFGFKEAFKFFKEMQLLKE